jgi:hypothetical protein
LLDTLGNWSAQLETAKGEPDPLKTIVHVQRNIEQTAFAIRRVIGPDPPDTGPNVP